MQFIQNLKNHINLLYIANLWDKLGKYDDDVITNKFCIRILIKTHLVLKTVLWSVLISVSLILILIGSGVFAVSTRYDRHICFFLVYMECFMSFIIMCTSAIISLELGKGEGEVG